MAPMAKSKSKRWFLREWIKKRGLTQEEVRERLGISKGRMSDLVSMKERWNEDHLAQFAEVLGVERWELLEVDPSEQEANGPVSIFDAIRRLPPNDRDRALRAARSVIDTFAAPKKKA